MKVHCFFEQSGTFKKEFVKLGCEAYDYDIQNEFGQTDFVIDLFHEIEGGYDGEPSIFDNIKPEDLIMAFFPCTYFECQSQMWFYGSNYSMKNYTDEQKLEVAMKRHEKLNQFYTLLCKLVIICKRKGLRMIIENPQSQPHYLTTYWCMKPSIIDTDRTARGDYYKKPTQYWFINMEPQQNLVFEPYDYVEIRTIAGKPVDGVGKTTARSMIHPQYANRFIREFILEE